MISFFHLPKPRQFKYRPRFYDPELEKFEDLRQKYYKTESVRVDDEVLNYYRKRVRSIDKEQTSSVSSLFKKKVVPKFNYQPRFISKDEEIIEKSGQNKMEFKPMFNDRKDSVESFSLRQIIITIITVLLLLGWIFF